MLTEPSLCLEFHSLIPHNFCMGWPLWVKLGESELTWSTGGDLNLMNVVFYPGVWPCYLINFLSPKDGGLIGAIGNMWWAIFSQRVLHFIVASAFHPIKRGKRNSQSNYLKRDWKHCWGKTAPVWNPNLTSYIQSHFYESETAEKAVLSSLDLLVAFPGLCRTPNNLSCVLNSIFFFLSAIVCPWLNVGLPPRCPQVVRCHWGKIEPFSVTLAQDGLAECDQPGKNPFKYSAVAENWTRTTGRTDSELSHWAIMTD